MVAPLPPIVRDARRVLLDIEKAVQRFPRGHKYVIGTDLRRQAMEVARASDRVWRAGTRQLQRVHELAEAVDNLKLTIQLGKEIQAFRSFGEFEALAELVAGLGRQCGGWLKRLHSKGQSARAAEPPGQRATILSSRSASGEANT